MDGKKFKILLISFSLVGFLLGMAISYIYLNFFLKHKTGDRSSTIDNNIVYNTPSGVNKDKTTLLLLGHGGGGHQGGGLADTIIYLEVDHIAKKIALVSIPRDFSLDGVNKINTVYLKGADNARAEVARLVGHPIDYYISVDFNQYIKSIEVLGDLQVEIPQTFDDNYYPLRGKELDTCGYTPAEVSKLSSTLSGFELEKNFECRYERLHFEKGTMVMDGSVALKFVRSRHSATYGGDFARGERQQMVLTAIGNKLISIDAISKIDDLYKEISGLVSTNLNLDILKAIANIIKSPEKYEIVHIYLTDQNVLKSKTSSTGAYILVPSGDNITSVTSYINKEKSSAGLEAE